MDEPLGVNGEAALPDRPPCPHCGGRRVHRHGTLRRRDGGQSRRFLCVPCGRTYSESTGTPAYRLRKRAEWDQMVMLLADNVPLRRMARLLRIQLETAFRWRHRALAILRLEPREPLSGEVNVTHLLVPYSEKGSRVCNGPGSWGYWNWLRRGPQPAYWSPNPAVRLPWPQPQRPRFLRFIDGRPTCVMVAQTKRGYELAVLEQERFSADMLARGLRELVRTGAGVCAFGDRSYRDACDRAGLPYTDGYRVPWERTDEEGGRVRCPDVPSWWMKQFRGVATRYLPQYLAWYRDIARVAKVDGDQTEVPEDGRCLLLAGAA